MKLVTTLIILLFYTLSLTKLNAQIVSIPFMEDDGWIFIKVKVNDNSKPLNFIFDTGATSTVIDKNAAKRLNINSDYDQFAVGASGAEKYKIALNQNINVSGIDFENINLILVDLNKFSKKSDIRVDGIIGFNILNQYITKFNFEAKIITLHKNINDIIELGLYKKIKMELNEFPIPSIELDFVLNNGEQVTGKFLFDSGANRTIIFNKSFSKKNDLYEKVGKTTKMKGKGLVSGFSETGGSVNSINFKGFEFKDLPVRLSNAESGVLSFPGYSGILGGKIIHRFDMILDYKNNFFYFKPNYKYSKPFNFPLAGFTLEKDNNKVLISDLIQGSEAQINGIKEGDIVLAINNKHKTSLKEYRDLLKNEGEIVEITLKDITEKGKKVKIKLKRII